MKDLKGVLNSSMTGGKKRRECTNLISPQKRKRLGLKSIISNNREKRDRSWPADAGGSKTAKKVQSFEKNKSSQRALKIERKRGWCRENLPQEKTERIDSSEEIIKEPWSHFRLSDWPGLLSSEKDLISRGGGPYKHLAV